MLVRPFVRPEMYVHDMETFPKYKLNKKRNFSYFRQTKQVGTNIAATLIQFVYLFPGTISWMLSGK